MRVVITDGGKPASLKTDKDCVVRAITLVTGKPYMEVSQRIAELAQAERPKMRRGKAKVSSPTTGVFRFTWEKLCTEYGMTWVSCMSIGSGCQVHLKDGELPAQGKLIARVSKHFTAVIDGVIHDTHDPSRGGTRCVYGYWKMP